MTDSWCKHSTQVKHYLLACLLCFYRKSAYHNNNKNYNKNFDK